jgi:soluble lytic murein transglycosylase
MLSFPRLASVMRDMVPMLRVSAFRWAMPLVLAVPLAAAAAPRSSVSQDDHFRAAREAFEKNRPAQLATHAEALRGHVLWPYVEYWKLRLAIDEAPAQAVRDFLARHSGALVATELRRDWLKALAGRQSWEAFESEYRNFAGEDAELACLALQARWRRGDAPAVEEFRRVWASPRDLPDGCHPIAESEIAAGRLTARDVWERARLLFEVGQFTGAKRLLGALPPGEAPDERAFESVRRGAQRFLAGAEKLDLKKGPNRELVLLALARTARADVEVAERHWTRGLRDRFPPEERAAVWGQLGSHGARQHHPRALEWFANANGVALRDDQLGWRARAALRGENWTEVRAAIEKMTPLGRNEPEWLYWHARARRALGQPEEAQILFARVAGEHHFYGKLALEELGRPLAIPPRGYTPTASDLAEAAANPGLQRAVALLRLGLRTEGIQEWNWSVRGMDDRRLLAAAEFARANEIWDRAIFTANQTVGLHDFSVRFPAPYRDVLGEQARSQGLDESWLLGLVRQESRFSPSAKSAAGASGLMQLMPRTAKWVAQRLRMKSFSASRLNDVDLNVALGTTYLKYVLDELDGHPVLAAAAYNAGPGRARKWKADRPLEGAIYAETIPLSETREYVKRVMSNTIYYATLYGGDGRSLKTRLGVVPPRRSGESYEATITGYATVE